MRELNLLAEECRRIDESKFAHVSLVNALLALGSLCKYRINGMRVQLAYAFALPICMGELCQQSVKILCMAHQQLNRPALTQNRHRSARKGIQRYVFATVPSIASCAVCIIHTMQVAS